MKYFPRENTQQETDKLYKILCKVLHPDKGGSNEAFIELKTQYDNWYEEEEEEPKVRMSFGAWHGYEVKNVPIHYLRWCIITPDLQKKYPNLMNYIKNFLKNL